MSFKRSKFACESSIKALAQDGEATLRLWTITLREQLPHGTGMSLLSHALKTLTSCGLRGVRVWELHPQGHGVHMHIVTDKFLPVSRVRQTLHQLDPHVGRIHVCRLHPDATCYAAKYLSKSQRENSTKARRLWAWFGPKLDSHGKRMHQRVSTVICRSRDADLIRAHMQKGLSWHAAIVHHHQFLMDRYKALDAYYSDIFHLERCYL